MLKITVTSLRHLCLCCLLAFYIVAKTWWREMIKKTVLRRGTNSQNILGFLNVKKILAVINATYAVVKRKPEKNQACRDSNPDLCDTGAAL